MKNLIYDDKAQTGSLIFLIFGLFLIGIVYVMMGYIMNENQAVNNQMISDTSHPYSQDRRDSMDNIYLNWWAFPIYMLLLFAIYAIKRAIDKHAGSAY